jgi:exodeoxyribonuclease V alpha subunit
LCPSQGHLFLTFSEIQNSINQFCLENNTKFLGKKIDLNDIDVHVTQLVKDKKLIFEDGNVYSTHNFKYEQTAARLLSKIISEPSDMIFLNQDKVTKHIEIFEHENGIQLSNEQKTALYYFAIHKVFVISGLPGTGKTLICKAVIELALKMNLKLTCLTPTGISAKKLSQTINYPSYTIHRRLQYRGNEWVYNENNPFETDLILIDESSMLDQEVLYRLLSAVKKRVHIIFIGDHNQLPSVGAGNVLKELIDCGNIPTIKLDKIFRQNEASDIIAASHKIIKGDTDLSLFKDDPKSDIVFIRTQKPSEIEEIVKELAKKLKDEKKLFQIIAARNDGPCGVNPLNTILQASLNPHKDELKEINLKNFVIRCGDRVIIKKNDYEHDIYNGDIGKVISMSGGNIVLAIDERQVELTIDEASEILKLAYAQTVHSVQGQEYPTIILIFINQYGRLIYRNLLYTALTRAKKKVIVIGHGSAIEKAILNANVTKRNTLLGQRITKCLQNEKNPSLLELQPQQQTFQIVTN